MAEDVMENVRFLQIVELFGRTNEIARGETPVREMIEKHIVWNETKAGYS